MKKITVTVDFEVSVPDDLTSEEIEGICCDIDTSQMTLDTLWSRGAIEPAIIHGYTTMNVEENE